MNIIGSKKGSSKPRQPIIAPDSAQSKAYLNMLYGLGEGEILGLANGYKSVYLDGTPLQNESGEFNFPSVKVDFRTGTNDQEYIDGFPDVASETNVGVELKHGTPWVKSFNNLDLDALRVRLKWGALRSQNTESGDVSGIKIDYAIDVKTDNGGWVEMLNTTINAKTSDAYERSHRIDLPTAQTDWQVRVRRLTPNSKSDLVSDKMFVSAITEVIDLKLRYPNTALLGLRCDATSFNNVPKISVRCKGLIIKVPTNYDPVTRTYTGLWNGEFKLAYSNNPAWVYYDLCTNTRYGLGNRLTPAMIDKWSLYRLAQYCDEMVDDGMGGQEPRFTVNVYIQSSEGAFELLSRLAGVFRAISYWDGNSIVVDADIPQDSIYSFSRANVIDGVFEYTGTRARDRHTVAKVAWDNPNNHFKTEYEFVRDEKAIAKFGVRIADISAWGCTSKGQAQRAGLWALKSEQLETRMVTFKVGLDGFIPTPAKVIEISDELFAGRATGGRVLAINKTKTVITLDRSVIAKTGDTLVINGDDGVSQRRQIKSVSGDKVTVTKAFTNISVENVWVLDSQDLATMKFRVLSVTADENHQFTITAVQYNPDKYEAIDTGAYIDERPISVINPTVQAPTKSVNLSSYHTVNQGVSITTLVIGWEQVTGAVKYQVEWRKDNGNWQTLPPTGTNSIEITGVYAGQYEARVTAISAFGQASLATHSNLTEIQGKVGRPTKLAKLTVQGVLFGMELGWLFGAKSEDTNYTEIQVSPNGQSNITTLGTFAYPTNKHEITGLQGNLTQFYRGRIVDKLGNTSDWTAWVSGTTDARADKVLDILSGQISQSHLDQTLRTPIAKIGGLETDLNGVKTQIPTIRNEIANAKTSLQSAIDAVNAQLPTLNGQITTLNGKTTTLQNELNIAKNTLQTAVTNITTERNRINTAIRDITALQSANNAKTQEIANLTQTVGGHTSSIRELGVTTGDLTQKYSQLKTATDTANSEITAIKQTQSGQATSIERLGARFDNLAVGGENLLRGTASPKLGSGTWQTATFRKSGNGTLETVVLSDSPIKDVATGLKLTPSRIDNFGLGFAQDQYALELGNYTLSFWINGVAGDRIKVQPFWASQNQSVPTTIITLKGGWEYVSFTGKNTVGGINQSIGYVYLMPVNLGNTATIVAPMLEKATIASAWQPSRFDVQSDIDSKATTANLETLRQTLSNADTALSGQITALDTAYKSADRTLTANLASETTARTSADTALGQRIDNLTTDYNGNKASVANQLKTLSDKDTATASQISSLTANVTTTQNTANTANSKADTATTKADNAQRTANDAVSRANSANSAITAEQRARADADTALGQRISAIDTAYKSADSNLTARLAGEETARTNGDNANSQAIRTLESTVNGIGGRVGTSESKIASLERTTSDTNQALATAQSQMNARFDTLNNAIIVKDTRNDNQPPAWYWTNHPQRVVNEFKYASVLGLSDFGEYINLETRVYWGDSTGGNIIQTAYHQADPTKQMQRQSQGAGNGATWCAWQAPFMNVLNQSQANLNEFKQAQATKDTATAQKLSQLESNLGTKANATALSNYYTKAEADNAMSGRVDTLRASINSELAKLQKALKVTELDLRHLDANTYYPVTFTGLHHVEPRLIRISRNLSQYPEKPTWASHNGGFSLLCEWVVNSSGWGTIAVTRNITTFAFAGITNNQSPLININQMTNSSQEYCYLRGGARYKLEAHDSIVATIRTASYSAYGQTVTPTAYNANLIPKSDKKAVEALIVEERTTRTTANTALSQQINTLQTTLNGQTASIQQHAQSLNGLSAQWTLKVQSGNIISGIGLASSNGVSDFAVRADKFYIAPPSGGKGLMPFVVQTTQQTINGVSVPAGTYIDSAFIRRGSISMLHIQDSIQSDNYVQGRSGWRLFKNGNLEINSSFGDGTRIQLNSRGLTGWYANGQKAFELGILS